MIKVLCYLFLFGFSFQAMSQTGDANTIINDPNAEARKVGDFNSISVSHGILLTLKQGEKMGVAVSAAEREYRDKIKTEVVGGVLKIYYENEQWWKNNRNSKKLKAYVSVKDLTSLSGSAGSVIRVDGSIKSNDLQLKLSSGSTLQGDFQASSLNIDQSSGAYSKVSGKAQNVTVETSSGSNFNGYNLFAETCNAHSSSGGLIEISVNGEIDGKASSGGSIRYKGNGVLKNKSTSSGGSVSKNG